MDMVEKTDTASTNLQQKDKTDVKICVFLTIF